jgi:hypothetical protein
MPSLSRPPRLTLATTVTLGGGIVLPLPTYQPARGRASPCLARTAVRSTRTDRVVFSRHQP